MKLTIWTEQKLQQKTEKSQQIGQVQQILQQDADNKRQYADTLAKLDALQQQVRQWERLNNIFGDSTGKTFRKIAQSFILQKLLDDGKTVVLLGGSDDLVFPIYKAYEILGRVINICSVDSRFNLEGGEEILPAIHHMIQAGVPVMGHLGLTPQSVNQFGGYGLRAKEEAEAEKLLRDAKLLDEAGCFSIVLEKIPAALAEKVTKAVSCPVIGIGAGNACDGQVLVLHDMLGLNTGFKPKFLRHFANLAENVKDAVSTYISAVKDTSFPNAEECY